jgi:hypothetical protein
VEPAAAAVGFDVWFGTRVFATGLGIVDVGVVARLVGSGVGVGVFLNC